MPAKAVLFDQRVRTLHDFGSAPYNFISFNPQARLIALAGFGNLAGQVSIFDRKTLQKVTTISAPNTSHCSWSPDGRFLLTATLSPRLRVDNGVKIWHCTGPLIHVQPIEELYQVSWKPLLGSGPPPFPATIPTAPKPSAAAEVVVVSTPPVASDGVVKAYRPPGARGGATPSIFKREDEGGLKSSPSGSPSNTPGPPGLGGQRYSRDGRDPRGGGVNGNGVVNGGRRYVPGAAPSPSHANGNGNGNGSPSPGPNGAKNSKNKKKPKQPGGPGAGGAGTPPPGIALPNAAGAGGGMTTPKEGGIGEIAIDAPVPVPVDALRGTVPGLIAGVAGLGIPGVEAGGEGPMTPSEEGGNLDSVAKKVRNLTKKVRPASISCSFDHFSSFLSVGDDADACLVQLKAIEELKEKAKRGERLEATQVRKMDGEAEIRKELAGLGGAGAS